MLATKIIVLFNNRHQMTILPGFPAVQDLSIKTTANTAYGVVKQGRGAANEDENYVVMRTAVCDYEIPLSRSHRPLLVVPRPAATPTYENVAGDIKKEEHEYELIPEDK